MKIENYIHNIQTNLICTHQGLLGWLMEKEAIKHYRPADGGWTILEILEHVSLTSHFLLKLIDKAADKAMRNVNDLSLEKELAEFNFDLNKLYNIGRHKSFEWIRPEHMEPTGHKDELVIKQTLTDQFLRCMNHLSNLKHGEGLLYKTTMSVDNLGKLNVYEYIYFLIRHAIRHLVQMEENKTEFIRLC
ncbi:MAG: DinB family protein [Bacteroidota bacterium]